MRFGLSVYGALLFPDDDLRNLIEYSRVHKITMWRVWLIWHDFGDWSNSVVSRDGTINPGALNRLNELVNFAYNQAGISMHLTFSNPGFLDSGGPSRVPGTANQIASNLAGFPREAVSYDLWNEQDGKTTDYPGGREKYLKDVRDRIKAAAPQHRVTFSLAAEAIPGVSRPALHAVIYGGAFLGGDIALDFYASHPKRDADWASNNQAHFEELSEKLAFYGDGILPNVDAYWDDEGRRVGDQDAGGSGADPTVQERVDAAQGAKDAGCEVHIFHTAAFFNPPGSLTFSGPGNEDEAIKRIAEEVIEGEIIDPEPPVDPPGPEPC